MLDGRAGGAAVRVEGGVQQEVIHIPIGNGQVAEGENEDILQGTSEALTDDFRTVLMISDSRAALDGIRSTAPRSGDCHERLRIRKRTAT